MGLGEKEQEGGDGMRECRKSARRRVFDDLNIWIWEPSKFEICSGIIGELQGYELRVHCLEISLSWMGTEFRKTGNVCF